MTDWSVPVTCLAGTIPQEPLNSLDDKRSYCARCPNEKKEARRGCLTCWPKIVPLVRGELRAVWPRGPEGAWCVTVAGIMPHAKETPGNMSFIGSPRGDREPRAANPQGAVSQVGGTPGITGEVRHSLPVGVPPAVRQGWRALPQRQSHCSRSPGPVFQEGCGTWEQWDMSGMSCGNVGRDRKVPSQNAVRRARVPAFRPPCRGTEASPTHACFSSLLCSRQGWGRGPGCSQKEKRFGCFLGPGPERGACPSPGVLSWAPSELPSSAQIL